ncbi:MAG: Hsp33 family molecular chaperone HslO [Lachnospiraceae bacterium]|nr:Hsp33 family molecular chaperone HslO [Lachnospiraceae bacterium]
MAGDYLVRATAADDAIRAFAVSTRELTEKARAMHNTSPVATAALGRLMAAGLMMGSMMKGEDDLLTLKITGNGPMRGALVTANSHCQVKGYVYEPGVLLGANARGKLDVGGAIGQGTLFVIRDLGMKEPYVGQTELVSGEIAEDLTYYFAVSEQVPSSVGLGVLMERNNTVRCAGGFLLQLMPYTKEEVITKLEERLAHVNSVTAMLDSGMEPEEILTELVGGLGLQISDRQPVSYHCGCSKERVSRAILSIGKQELLTMLSDGKPVEAGCQFCDQKYRFEAEEIREMLEKA